MTELLIPIIVAVVTGATGLAIAFANGWFKRKSDSTSREDAYTDRLSKRLEHMETGYDERALKIAEMSVRIAELSAQNSSVTAALKHLDQDFKALQKDFSEVQTEGRFMLAFIQIQQLYGDYLEWVRDHKKSGIPRSEKT